MWLTLQGCFNQNRTAKVVGLAAKWPSVTLFRRSPGILKAKRKAVCRTSLLGWLEIRPEIWLKGEMPTLSEVPTTSTVAVLGVRDCVVSRPGCEWEAWCTCLPAGKLCLELLAGNPLHPINTALHFLQCAQRLPGFSQGRELLHAVRTQPRSEMLLSAWTRSHCTYVICFPGGPCNNPSMWISRLNLAPRAQVDMWPRECVSCVHYTNTILWLQDEKSSSLEAPRKLDQLEHLCHHWMTWTVVFLQVPLATFIPCYWPVYQMWHVIIIIIILIIVPFLAFRVKEEEGGCCFSIFFPTFYSFGGLNHTSWLHD